MISTLVVAIAVAAVAGAPPAAGTRLELGGGRRVLDPSPRRDVALAARVGFPGSPSSPRLRWDRASLIARLDPANQRHLALRATSDGRAEIELLDGSGLEISAATLPPLPAPPPTTPVTRELRLETHGVLVRGRVDDAVVEALDFTLGSGGTAVEAETYAHAPLVFEELGDGPADPQVLAWVDLAAAPPLAAGLALVSPLGEVGLRLVLHNHAAEDRAFTATLEIGRSDAAAPDDAVSTGPIRVAGGGSAESKLCFSRREPGVARLRLRVHDETGAVVNAPGGATGRIRFAAPVEMTLDRVVWRPREALTGRVVTRVSGSIHPTFEIRWLGASGARAAIRIRPAIAADGRFTLSLEHLHAPAWYDLAVRVGGVPALTRFGVFAPWKAPSLPPIDEATVREDGVVLVNGRPFFPVDLIHGSLAWLNGIALPPGTSPGALLDAARARGVNIAGEGGGPGNVSAHFTEHTLYTLDRRVGSGLRGGRYDPASFAADLARLRLPDGRFLPGWLGGGLGDEPDLALVYGRASLNEINAGLRALKERMPGRLVHAELSNDAAAIAALMEPLDAFVIGFAGRPRDVAALTDVAVRAASGRATPASPWGTGIELMTIDDPMHLRPTPGPWQVRAAVFAAIIHGARGLELYPLHQGELLSERSPAVWSMLAGLAFETRELARRIVFPRGDAAPGFSWKAVGGRSGDLHATARGAPGEVAIAAVNVSASETLGARFEIAGLRRGARIRVLFEDRDIRAHDGGFDDLFAPYDGHLYVVRVGR